LAEKGIKVSFVLDKDVSPSLDRQLIELLSVCYPTTPDWLDRSQRHFKEIPRYRWFIQMEGAMVLAQVAVHDKVFGTEEGEVGAGGIAEVAVHPSCRGRGYVHLMLDEVEKFLRVSGVSFAVLFGDGKIYGSRGYRAESNPCRYLDVVEKKLKITTEHSLRVKPLGEKSWPEGSIDLRGPLF
jgi:GNAT superfamily N-acetyltransferase